MKRQMCWDEIKKRFPDEWVALANYHQKDAEEIEGVVVAHHQDRKEFHETVAKLLPTRGNMATRFTGTLIKNPEIPLLWQISPTG